MLPTVGTKKNRQARNREGGSRSSMKQYVHDRYRLIFPIHFATASVDRDPSKDTGFE